MEGHQSTVEGPQNTIHQQKLTAILQLKNRINTSEDEVINLEFDNEGFDPSWRDSRRFLYGPFTLLMVFTCFLVYVALMMSAKPCALCQQVDCLHLAHVVLSSMNNSTNPCGYMDEFACPPPIRSDRNGNQTNGSLIKHKQRPLSLDQYATKLVLRILSAPLNNSDPGTFQDAKQIFQACDNLRHRHRLVVEKFVKVLKEYGGLYVLYQSCCLIYGVYTPPIQYMDNPTYP